ncbi:hypothetical protein Patl1_01823 [Pistacia atlantica]|uniref:Uncharacterized protein n=1 Tax=Pistacia atlantica TaxID=434234 RepID=A0ACC1C9L3_9ROSI|nr:hypothetical protein Patl1_01823 [Pistacia atlantica]
MAAVGKTIYVFGGRDGTHKELNELYSFDTSTNKWTLLSSADAGPPHRSYHSMTADDRHVCIFGGCGVSGRLNDLWAFDVVDQKWIKYPTPGEKPTARGVFSTVGIGKYIIVYGGEIDPSDLGHMGAGKFSGELYSLDTETLVWTRWDDGQDSNIHPGPRGWCAFAGGCRDGKQGLLVYGGNSPAMIGLKTFSSSLLPPNVYDE